MKSYAMLPLVLFGVVGGVYLFQFRAVPRVTPREPLPQQQAPVAALPAVVPSPVAVQSQKPAALLVQGHVVAQKELEIKSKTGGIVRNVGVEIGQSVKQGQLLAELDPSDALKQVRRAEASLTAAKSRLEQARENLTIAQMSIGAQSARAGACIKSAAAKASRTRSRADRIKEVMKKCAISQEESDEAEASAVEAAANLELSKVQLDDVKTQEMSLDLRRQDVACAEAQVTLDEIALQDAQQRLAETKILAPMDGVVTARAIQPGQFVAAGTSSPDTSMLTISDLLKLFVTARVPVGQASDIKIGQAAAIHVETRNDAAIEGKVVFIAPCGTNSGKDVAVSIKIELLGEMQGLKPETLVEVEFVPRGRP